MSALLSQRLYKWLPDLKGADYHVKNPRMMFAILWYNLVLAILAIFFCLQTASGIGFQYAAVGASVAFICASLNFAGILCVYFKNNNVLACHLLIGAILFGLLSGIHLTGGFGTSPLVQALVTIPTLGFLLLSIKGGFFWSVVLLVGSMISSMLTVNNLWVYSLLPNNYLKYITTVMFFLHLPLIGGVLVLYEKFNRKLHEELEKESGQLRYEATHDFLTNAPNRLEFFRQLEKGCVRALLNKKPLALMYIDLDKFKPINDQYGHHIGDLVLVETVERLNAALSASDTVARLGGDEFALILPNKTMPDDIQSIASTLLSVIREPMLIEGLELQINASIGVAMYPDDSQDIDELCRYADKAMYLGKQKGGTCIYYSNEYSFVETL